MIFEPSVSHWLALANYQSGRQLFDLADTQATALAPVVMAIWESRLKAIQHTIGHRRRRLAGPARRAPQPQRLAGLRHPQRAAHRLLRAYRPDGQFDGALDADRRVLRQRPRQRLHRPPPDARRSAQRRRAAGRPRHRRTDPPLLDPHDRVQRVHRAGSAVSRLRGAGRKRPDLHQSRLDRLQTAGEAGRALPERGDVLARAPDGHRQCRLDDAGSA